MPKKILYAASTFGHLKSFHVPYINTLLAHGHQVHLLGAGDPAGLPDTQKIMAGFEKKMTSTQNFKTAKTIRQLVKKEQYDIISVHTTLAAFFVRFALLFLRKRPYVINTVHGYLFDKNTPAAKRMVLLAAEKLTRPVTDTLAVMNQADYDIAKKHKLYKKQLVMTDGMGVDLSWYEMNQNLRRGSERLQKELYLPAGELVLVCAAEFSPRKNQMFLVEALAQLRRQGVRCHLILAGNGELFEQVKSQAVLLGVRMQTKLPGFVKDMAPYYHLADICVSASRSEGLPFQVMEAMACHLPVIASRVKGHEDLVEPGVNGLLFDYGDIDSFCEAVIQL